MAISISNVIAIATQFNYDVANDTSLGMRCECDYNQIVIGRIDRTHTYIYIYKRRTNSFQDNHSYGCFNSYVRSFEPK